MKVSSPRSKSVRRIALYRVWPIAASLAVLLAALPGGTTRAEKRSRARDDRPNILIIMTDDQRYDSFNSEFMPNTKALIAAQGIEFTRAYTSTPICNPSRASFLTGKYARNNGVHVNKDRLKETTLVDRLHEAGYYTGLTGKYLNSWNGEPRPEFDYWVGWNKDIVDPEMNISGEFRVVPGYMPYIIRDYAMDFLNNAPDDKPFFLMFTPVTPHAPANPAPGDERLYSDLPPNRPPNFNPAQDAGKPAWLRQLPQLTAAEVIEKDDERLDHLRCLHSLDLIVRDLLGKLEEQGKLDNTLVVFYSDNGLFFGEHRLRGKNRVYEEACRIPLALRYPPLVAGPRVDNHLVQVADLTSTIYELAGLPAPADLNGRSLASLVRGEGEWRDALLIEGWPGNFIHDTEPTNPDDRTNTQTTEHFKAIRTEQYVFVLTDKDRSELYDTEADPYQLNNLMDDPSYEKIAKKLRKRLRAGNL